MVTIYMRMYLTYFFFGFEEFVRQVIKFLHLFFIYKKIQKYFVHTVCRKGEGRKEGGLKKRIPKWYSTNLEQKLATVVCEHLVTELRVSIKMLLKLPKRSGQFLPSVKRIPLHDTSQRFTKILK